MKKKYLLLLSFVSLSMALNAQNSSITISQNTDQNNVTAGAVSCWVSDQQSDFYGDYYQNVYARSFDLSDDHNINDSFLISAIEIGLFRGDDITGTINVYYADQRDLSDPSNELTLVESKEYTFFDFANSSVVVIQDWDALIPTDKILVVEVDLPANQEATETGATNPNDFKIFGFGRNGEGETHHAWIKASECGVDEFVDLNTISNSPQHIIINVTGQETLSIQNEKFAQIQMYPNPVKNQLKVETPKDMQISDLSLIDVKGKRQKVRLIDGFLDMSNYPTGGYILELNTNFGKTTKKVIKK